MNPRPLHTSPHLPFMEGLRYNIALYTAPPGPAPYSGVGIGLLATLGVDRSAGILAPLLHDGFGAGHSGMLPVKGRVTEALMDRLMMEVFIPETGKWVPGSPARIGNAGLDGLFFHTDGEGHVRDILVGEAKYDSSRLGMTLSGRQMSESWVNQRLLRTARFYAEMAKQLKAQPLSRASGYARLKAMGRLVRIPLKEGGVAEVWSRPGGISCFIDRPLNATELAVQARRVAVYVEASATGKIDYRCRLLRYKAIGRQHQVLLQQWDPKTETLGKATTIRGEYADLPKPVRKAVHRVFEQGFRDLGKSGKEARQLADRACDDPGYFKRMSPDPRWTWKAGLDSYAIRTAAVAGGLALVLDVLFQLRAGKLSLTRSIAMGTVGTVSGFAAHYGGVQINSLLTATRVGRNILTALPIRTVAGAPLPSVLGGIGGGVIATVAFAYGSYLLGQTDLRGANRQFVAGTAGLASGAGFSAGAFGIAGAVGTASTGTTISSLSGAAATNATLAWLGGGAIAAGGYGIWGGLIVLTGGSAVVGIGVGFGATYLFRSLDSISQSRSQRFLLEGRLQIVSKRVNAGIQAEWQAARSAN